MCSRALTANISQFHSVTASRPGCNNLQPFMLLKCWQPLCASVFLNVSHLVGDKTLIKVKIKCAPPTLRLITWNTRWMDQWFSICSPPVDTQWTLRAPGHHCFTHTRTHIMRFSIVQVDTAERSSPAELIATVHLILLGKHNGRLLIATHVVLHIPHKQGRLLLYLPHQPRRYRIHKSLNNLNIQHSDQRSETLMRRRHFFKPSLLKCCFVHEASALNIFQQDDTWQVELPGRAAKGCWWHDG